MLIIWMKEKTGWSTKYIHSIICKRIRNKFETPYAIVICDVDEMPNKDHSYNLLHKDAKNEALYLIMVTHKNMPVFGDNICSNWARMWYFLPL